MSRLPVTLGVFSILAALVATCSKAQAQGTVQLYGRMNVTLVS